MSMAGNGGSNSIAASAAAQTAGTGVRSKWSGCLAGLSCFGSQKGGTRIVPAARTAVGNVSTNNANGPRTGGSANQTIAFNLALLAPPSSPASFTNSALPSTAQSPNCFLSISPGPSSTMFVTGPYAHETQLVSPPVFSTYTTEPSTAPLTPPPELAHLTTPSSPDVPFARFLSSSMEINTSRKQSGMPFTSTYSSSGLQASYSISLYPESPSSSLISPASATPRTGLSSPFPEREAPPKWNTSLSAHDSPCSRSAASRLFGRDYASSRNFMLDSSFFCPAPSAQFYLDQAQQSPYVGGRRSVSQDRHNRNGKQDVEETEAYRASFGFSADEIISGQHSVEINDERDESFVISALHGSNTCQSQTSFTELHEKSKGCKAERTFLEFNSGVPNADMEKNSDGEPIKALDCGIALAGLKSSFPVETSEISKEGHPFMKLKEMALPKNLEIKTKVSAEQSCSDAETDYRRARSLREAASMFAVCSSLSS